MTGHLIQQPNLTTTHRDAMFAMLDTYFEGVTRVQFDSDLAEKNWAIIIEQEGTLLGFSTVLVYPEIFEGERLTVVCSGDTIVAPVAWGSMAFPRTWIQSVYELRDRYPDGRLVWLLLTSGYRTYRFLPVFWREFFPRVNTATPPRWQQLLTRLASDRFGRRYCPERGIVRFENPQRLRGALAEISQGRLDDPDVKFFVDRNPEHRHGDELVCMADLCPDNLTPAGRRIVYGASR